MSQPILSFSPDGGQRVYTLTASLSWFALALLSIIGCCALALVKFSEIAMSLINFFLTASPESLLRIVLLAVLVVAVTAFFCWQKGAFHVGKTRTIPDSGN